MKLLKSPAMFWVGAAVLLATAMSAAAQDAQALQATDAPAGSVWLETLNLGNVTQGWKVAQAGKSVGGNPIKIAGVTYPHGIGTHAQSVMIVDLKGAATHFAAMVGVDSEVGTKGTIQFAVMVDGKKVASTPIMKGGEAARLISVDLTGAKRMILRVDDGGDGIDSDHADWAGALLTLAPGATAKPQTMAEPAAPQEPGRLVIPPPNPAPAIHGAPIVGATPGYPFEFLIPATGDQPLTYSATGLPAGLTLDPATGIISGALTEAATTRVTLSVTNAIGTATRELTIVGGDHKLALTPPMGWNSWNVWAGAVNADRVRAAADAMVASGLAAHGFQYVNIDDTWEGKQRTADGQITTNDKFGDMKALADYVHGKGLKLGIYSSPGPRTCAGYLGSYQHEDQDAQSYADWGIDYLKYDWCSYGGIAGNDHSLAAYQKPYAVMRASLDKVKRDILFSFCQYGMGSVWQWGAKIGGNCWRTTGDIRDNWKSLDGILQSQNGHEKYAGPGHWNDPDMLVVGKVGWGSPHPSHLTQNEQILHISMWCMLSAPLLIGCDMTQMDEFTRAVLTNDEVLAIDQDPLGKPAGRLTPADVTSQVWARPLSDGAEAVALLNTDIVPATVTVNWKDLGITGAQPVRDLWLHKDLGDFTDSYSVEVPVHGCVLLKIGAPKQ